jgi:OOP family OmpA-OmpF porin
MKRAKNVKDLLVRRYGIQTERVETKWHGETRPVAKNDSAEGRALNRRSEMLIITLSD